MPSKNGNSSSDTSSTRIQRNLAEKQRRYKLNSYISELANIVPMVSMSSKRLDKTSILRLSAAHLRIYQSPLIGNHKHSLKPYFKWRPNCLDADNIWKILEAVDGFLLLTTGSGKIIYISQSVEQFLGHQHIEMIGHSLLSFVHPADVETVQNQLEKLVMVTNEQKGKINSDRCSFYCRIRERCQPRSEVVTYQLIHIVGHMTLTVDKSENENNSVLNQMNCLFKAFVRVVHTKPCNELLLNDAIEDEYVTRHSLDGTIIFADHRLSTITGHLPHEVFGRSAYHYIIADDIPVALFAHKLMFANNVGRGLIVYRLRTSNQGSVYLKSSGYLQYDKSSSKIDHFVCVNKLLSDEEGEEELKKFIERFTPHIHNTTVHSMYESICSVQTSGMIVSNGKSEKEQNDHLVTLEKMPVNVTEAKTQESQLNLTQNKSLSGINNRSYCYRGMTTNGIKSRHLSSMCNNDCKKQSNIVSNCAYDLSCTAINGYRITNGTDNTKSTASHKIKFFHSEKKNYAHSECSSNDDNDSSLSDEYENQCSKQHTKVKSSLSTIDCYQLYSINQFGLRTSPQSNSSPSINGLSENQYSNDSTSSSENPPPCKVFKATFTESSNKVNSDLKVPVKSWFSDNESSMIKNNNCSYEGSLIQSNNHIVHQKLESNCRPDSNASKSFADILSTAISTNNRSCISEHSDVLSLKNDDYLASEL
ncbi:basic helix-loop-helix ARNT-like protein 2 isoform X2 [Centruroides vittatus]|uniref:basic helix-loop-helix ARNT-like protein 2 isoform X2 n=1 Tax=Centruroides vittatus TaxID=120091 RepID=UPI00350EE505